MKYYLLLLVLGCFMLETFSMPMEDDDLISESLHSSNVRHIVKRLAIPGCQSGQVKLGYTTTEKGKSSTHVISFSPEFKGAPALVYGLSHLDSIATENVRITTEVQDLSSTGFTLIVKSWAPTLTYDAWVQWMACPRITNI